MADGCGSNGDWAQYSGPHQTPRVEAKERIGPGSAEVSA